MGRDRELKWLAFSLYPFNFSFTVPLSDVKKMHFYMFLLFIADIILSFLFLTLFRETGGFYIWVCWVFLNIISLNNYRKYIGYNKITEELKKSYRKNIFYISRLRIRTLPPRIQILGSIRYLQVKNYIK